MPARGPTAPRHHELELARFTCSWGDGTRQGCRRQGHRAFNVPDRPGRVYIFCKEHDQEYTATRIQERVDRHAGETGEDEGDQH
jgi:hypothetical protein